MTFDKFTMYLKTIPEYSTDKDEEEGTDKKDTPKEKPTTGGFNLFDFDQR